MKTIQIQINAGDPQYLNPPTIGMNYTFTDTSRWANETFIVVNYFRCDYLGVGILELERVG